MRDALTSATPSTSREAALKRRREYAAEMRAKGFKRKLVWVIDTDRPGFKEECRREMESIVDHERRWREEHPDAPEDDILAACAIPGGGGQEE
ncbi:MAG TPA: antitoxin MazE-like protein [Acidobacteriaceae bacterium]|jgi:hypothetical protein|nr:antitoxin MazE-like protein [Acidobacteriaceae bacterium]